MSPSLRFVAVWIQRMMSSPYQAVADDWLRLAEGGLAERSSAGILRSPLISPVGKLTFFACTRHW